MINDNYREIYKDYEITTEQTKSSKLVGDRYFTAKAKKNGIIYFEYQSPFGFDSAVEQIKTQIDFKLP